MTANHVIKKDIPWRPEFELLTVGTVFEAEFGIAGKDGRSMDFLITDVIRDNDTFGLADSTTFIMEEHRRSEPDIFDYDDVPFNETP